MRGIFSICLLCFALTGFSQKTYLYDFNSGNLEERSGKGPALIPLGGNGRFITEQLTELGNLKRKVYRFQSNCGLRFDIANADSKFSGSYSIELYFKLDALDSWKRILDFKNRTTDNGAYIFNGKINFYKIITSDLAPVRPNQYTHYTVTYDAQTRMLNMYADGVREITFFDKNDDAAIDSHGINFFYDDLIVKNEASAGTVSYIKLFDYTVSPENVRLNYEDLKQTLDPASVKVVHKKTEFISTDLNIKVVNINTSEPVISKISIRNKETNTISVEEGIGSHVQLKKRNYMINVKAQGFTETNLEMKADTGIEHVLEVVSLTPIALGVNVRLENVHFQQGFADLLKDSYPVLDHLVKLMQDNENMQIELSGHTDNEGNPKLNLVLSEQRVDMIKKYLVEHGIQEVRISGKGYGDTQPLAPNDKEANRKQNRRVEIKVLQI